MLKKSTILSDLDSDTGVLGYLKNIQDSEFSTDFSFLEKEVRKFSELEMGIWYHLISPLSDTEKVQEIFHTMKSNLVKRAENLGAIIGLDT